jgi:N-glycosidase YbiA
MIEHFEGEYAFLSNFWPSPIVLDRITHPTVEHAYQAAKADNRLERERLASLPTPGAAKRAGRKVTLRSDWERVKVGIMEDLVRRKFADPDLAERLLATGEAELVEGNAWNDRFWGVCRGEGRNELGKVLMRVRAELRGMPRRDDREAAVPEQGTG